MLNALISEMVCNDGCLAIWVKEQCTAKISEFQVGIRPKTLMLVKHAKH